MTKYTTISIPEPLADKLRKFLDGTGFKSNSDFVTFVLREILIEDNSKKSKAYTKEKEAVLGRLKALGYLK